jgi:hypothetical protein
MFLLVRDEDAPTVAGAIRAFAEDEGLVPIDLEDRVQDPLAMLAVLTGPRVLVSATDDQVAAFGLETLDIADADEWGAAISRACSSEVVAFEPAADGVRVYVFDDGEVDETIEVALHRSGRTRAPTLVDLTDDEEGKRALTDGVVASTGPDLASGLLRAFGISGPGQDAMMLGFVDPLDEDDSDEGDDDVDAEPSTGRLLVDAVPAAELNGREGGSVTSLNGSLFAVFLEGGTSVEGVRLELFGDGLALFEIETLDLVLRARGAEEREPRQLKLEGGPKDGPIVVTIDDAVFERIDEQLPMVDPTDMFSTMQRLMNAGNARQHNTMIVDVRGIARKVGEGSLELRVSALADDTILAGEASVPVHVRPR